MPRQVVDRVMGSAVMQAEVDHLAMGTTQGAMKLARFYTDVIGFEPIRFDRFEQGKAPFPSVRVNSHTILDFFEPKLDADSDKPAATALSNNTHLCFAVSRDAHDAVVARLKNAGVTVSDEKNRFGARGDGKSIYCQDPEGNHLEFRYYP